MSAKLQGNPESKATSAVKSAARVLDIVEYLVEHPAGATLTTLSRALGIPPSSCHAILHTLVPRGYLLKDARDGSYRLSRKWARLVPGYEDMNLIEQADPVMDVMNDLCGESLSLAVMEQDELLVIHQKPAKGQVRTLTAVGTRLPVHATAQGKAILASWPKDRLDAWLSGRTLVRYTDSTITSVEELRHCLEEVRRTGIAHNREESAPGLLTVGTTIRDHRGEPIAALSVLVPYHRESDAPYCERLAQLVRAGASAISSALGSPSEASSAGLETMVAKWQQSDKSS